MKQDGGSQKLVAGNTAYADHGGIRQESKKQMCLLCAAGLDGQNLAQRAHVLQLLALVEHPDALPVDATLRLAREVLTLIQAERIGRRCDPVFPPEAAVADTTGRKSS